MISKTRRKSHINNSQKYLYCFFLFSIQNSETLSYATCNEINAYGFLPSLSFENKFPCLAPEKISNRTAECDAINFKYKVSDNFDVRCSCPSSRSRQESVFLVKIDYLIILIILN